MFNIILACHLSVFQVVFSCIIIIVKCFLYAWFASLGSHISHAYMYIVSVRTFCIYKLDGTLESFFNLGYFFGFFHLII